MVYELIRRLLLHALPDGFHRIRHYGYLANGHCAAKHDSPAAPWMFAPVVAVP